MIEAVQRIHVRIGEIQERFNKLGFAPLNTTPPTKPFSEHLNEAMAENSVKNNSQLDNINKTDNVAATVEASNKKINTSNNDAFNGKISFGVYDDASNSFSKALNAYKKASFPSTYDDIIKEASTKYSVPEDLIKAVIKQESNYMPNAVSHKGAIGLMQIMPSTGVGLGVTDKEMLKDPYTNIMAGTKYLSQMLNRYDGRLDLSLSAYNAGPSLVDKLQRIPNIDETKNYVKNIIGYIK